MERNDRESETILFLFRSIKENDPGKSITNMIKS